MSKLINNPHLAKMRSAQNRHVANGKWLARCMAHFYGIAEQGCKLLAHVSAAGLNPEHFQSIEVQEDRVEIGKHHNGDYYYCDRSHSGNGICLMAVDRTQVYDGLEEAESWLEQQEKAKWHSYIGVQPFCLDYQCRRVNEDGKAEMVLCDGTMVRQEGVKWVVVRRATRPRRLQ